MTKRINHVSEAERLTEISSGTYGQIDFRNEGMSVALMLEAQTLAVNAQVHATLALVEQQRIANLIAWTTANGTEPLKPEAKRITEALGL